MLGWVLLNRNRYFIIYSFSPQDDPDSHLKMGFLVFNTGKPYRYKVFSGEIFGLITLQIIRDYRCILPPPPNRDSTVYRTIDFI
jgi:hypothetical protein